jgi:hypothetical protein
MHLRSTQALAFDYVAIRIRNRELKDRLRQINCNSRGYHWMLLFLLARSPDIAISANVFAFSKKPIPSFRAIFSGTQASSSGLPVLLSSGTGALTFQDAPGRSRHGIYVQLASLVPREEYLYRAPHDTAEAFGLHIINHAQKDALQKF